MATNIVSQIMDFLTPDIVSKIAGYFGLDRYLTQKAIGAAVPALLAGLVGLSSKPEGARQLSSVLSQQPSGILDSVRALTTGQEQRTLTESGSSLLSSLFGGGALSALASALGRFTGIGEGTSKSLLGLLGPMVLGSVAQYQRQAGLDANGLASFLASQKANIAAATPSGFASMLGGTGLFDSLSDSLGDAWRSGGAAASTAAGRFAASPGETASDARRGVRDMGRDASTRASSNWLPWAVGLLVLAGLAWWLTSQSGQRVAEQARTTVAQPAQDLTVGGVNVVNQATSAINSMKSAL